jgi:hypothetical protein
MDCTRRINFKRNENISRFGTHFATFFSYPFVLRTDASIDGLGAVLSQVINNEERIILYIIRNVQPNEKNWSIQQLEALGIIWACETVRPFIIVTRVLIITDHKSLRWLKRQKCLDWIDGLVV